MKKILTILLAFALVLSASVTAFAADWSNRDVVSPYSVAIIPVKITTNMFGQTSYTQDFSTASAGDSVSFVVRVEVPEKSQEATLTLKSSDLVLNAVNLANVPVTHGVYYLTALGTFSSSFSIISGYCTGVPTVTANIRGAKTVESVGTLHITKSDGYIFSENGRGVAFYTDSLGKVYASYVFGIDYRYKLSSTILSEDSEVGAVARKVLKILGMDGADVLNGSVYITDDILAMNFGRLVNTSASHTWGADVKIIPVTPVAEVPATGSLGWGFLLLITAAWLSVGLWKRILKH